MTDATPARILRALESATARLEALERERTEPIAIVGLACRFPGGADDPESFWRLLQDGVDAVSEFPAERPPIEEHFDPDPDAPGRTYVRHGGFLGGVDRFDAAFFGISAREAQSLDPQQRLLLETAWHALERAGLTRERLRGSRTGVFVGITNCDYGRRLARALDRLDPYYVTGNTLNAAAGRLSYVLGLRGPSLAVDTACSSSLVAVHLACQSLRAGDSDVALAAGVNLILAPEGFVALSKARVLAPDGRCKTFDAAADGMGRAEGCGVVVLKRLSDAQRDRDDIVAVVRGSAVNQDGASGGLTVPNGPAQEDVIRQALHNAGVAPADVDYVEAHGTGTALGDPIELRALAQVFGAGRPARRPLVVGAVKANIAHAESAAGIAGIIKTALSLRHRTIPPQIHFHAPSPNVEWEAAPLVVPTRALPWPADGKRRLAGVSGFGFSGTNAHVVLEEAPAPVEGPAAGGGAAPRRDHAVLPLSAADPQALGALAERHAGRLREAGTRLEDICYSASVLRDHHGHRVAVVARSPAAAADALDAFVAGQQAPGVFRGPRPPRRGVDVVFAFPGQGAQSSGMGQDLYRREPVFRRVIDACGAILGRDVLGSGEAPADDTALAQPALFAFGYALAALWQSWGVAPAAVIGHSVGEYVAACIAGVFDLETGLRLVAERGRLMSALPRDGVMVAVFAPPDRVADLVRGRASRVSIAAVNGPEHVVISGERAAVEDTVAELRATGARATALAVSHAFHSPLMAPVLAPFRPLLESVKLRPPSITLVSGLTGEPVGEEVTRPDHWLRHVMEPVLFARGVSTLRERGYHAVLEVGPHPTLAGLGRACAGGAELQWIASLARGQDEGARIAQALAELYACGARIDWRAHHAGRDARRVDVPTYPFQRARHWFDEPRAGATASTDERLFEVAWLERPARAPRHEAARWLLLADGTGMAAALARRLRERGDEVTELPASATADLRRAMDEHLRSRAPRPLRIVHCWSLEVPAGAPAGAWERARALGWAGVLDVVTAVAGAERSAAATRLWIVTRGAQAIGGEEVSVLQAPLWGLGRVIALEHPDLWGGLVDLDPGAAVDVDALLAELDAAGGGAQVALRGGRRLVPRLSRCARPAPAPYRFSPAGSYLVSGGLGGLGLEVAAWMVREGARRLVLAGRRPPAAETQQKVDGLRKAGADVRIVLADFGDAAAVGRALAEADRDAPLRGIVHAAGMLDDGVLARQDPARFERVMAGKALGALHLDRLTRGRPLDFVVFFSSVASVLGSPGQGNYAAANALLDALAAERRRRGDPAVSIDWGPWAEVGMAAGLGEHERAVMRARGLSPLAVTDGLRLLARACRHEAPQVAAVALDAPALRQSPVGATLAIIDELAGPEASPASAGGAEPAPVDRAGVAAYLERRIRAILRLDRADALPPDAALVELGFDSMMATELRNGIVRDVRVDVPLVRFLAGPTVADLVELVHRELSLARLADGGEATSAPDVEEVVL
jgi:acyl transferase domain-containing protein